MSILDPFILPSKGANLLTRIKRFNYSPEFHTSAGTVTFYWDKMKSEPLFLQFFSEFKPGTGEWWFPKGHVEPGDTSVEYRALQETKEEVGLEVNLLNKLTDNKYTFYFDPKRIKVTKTVHYFLAQSLTQDVSFTRFNTDQNEIDHFKKFSWEPVNKAMEQTKHFVEKQMLQEAYSWIIKNNDKIVK
jgi:8-oxo-dGTP pyrophosphatase MutT (NUDIX family)